MGTPPASHCEPVSHRVPTAFRWPANPLFLASRGRATSSLPGSPIFSRNGETVLLRSTQTDELSRGQASGGGRAATDRPSRARAGGGSLKHARALQSLRGQESWCWHCRGDRWPQHPTAGHPWSHAGCPRRPASARGRDGEGSRDTQKRAEGAGGPGPPQKQQHAWGHRGTQPPRGSRGRLFRADPSRWLQTTCVRCLLMC